MDLFANRTELNKHLSSKDHTCLKVICLWCLGRQKMFTRVNDLKQHVITSYSSIFQALPSGFFTVGTRFFLSVHPEDYRRIVQVSPYKEECFEARKAVLRWCGSQLNVSKISQE